MELEVLGRKIGVRFISDKELHQIAGGAEYLGFFDSNTIYISSSLSQDHSKRVLVHELSHAILSITGLSNLLEENQEEAICDAMENLIQVFRDESIVKFLNSKEEDI